MSYNKQYNTRNSSGRYNTAGQFVSAGEQIPQLAQPPLPPYAPGTPSRKPAPPLPSQGHGHNQNQNQNLQTIQTMDVDMKQAQDSSNMSTTSETSSRPPWMKSKMQGVKKLSNKERRRRQNENLRRLLTPKNALMVLNEMLPNEQLTNQFKVEPAAQAQFSSQYYSHSQKQQNSFCADLTIKGHSYKGYGENKLTARNVAAEQAIRDIIIQKMNKVFTEGNDQGNGDGAAMEGAEGETDEDPLPMIQLASFALHKLFSEWEYEGHKVPQLKPAPAASVSEGGSEAGGSVTGGSGAGGASKPRPPVVKKKDLPLNAADMHPCMLLTYMRPHLEYRELAVDGDRPQNMIFTLGVDVDGSTYIGKAANKKEARKLAAKAACTSLWGVKFSDNPVENTPQVAPA